MIDYHCPLCLIFFPLSPGAAGVLVGHPFDTVKVGKGFIIRHVITEFDNNFMGLLKQFSVKHLFKIFYFKLNFIINFLLTIKHISHHFFWHIYLMLCAKYFSLSCQVTTIN